MTTPTEALFDALDRLGQHDDGGPTAPLSLPVALVEALHAAARLGLGATADTAATAILRDAVEAFAQRLALDEHFKTIGWRPSLTDLAVAAASLDASPLAEDRELLARAAEAVVAFRPDAGAQDVLVYAAGMLAGDGGR